MLRKCTLFFDPSLKYAGYDGPSSYAFDLAHEICVKFMETARLVSFGEDDPKHAVGLVERFVESFPHPGVLFHEEWIKDFAGAISRAYRIECIFRYPSESDWDDDKGHRVRYRQLSLQIRFFAKNERTPLHTDDFIFSRHDGNLI